MRVRYIFTDNTVSVVDQSWSQLCEAIKDKRPSREFWNGAEHITPEGVRIKLISF